VTKLQSMNFGDLIILFLIVEPNGLSAIGKERLRLWPFPHRGRGTVMSHPSLQRVEITASIRADRMAEKRRNRSSA
jgi:hypothetical protein